MKNFKQLKIFILLITFLFPVMILKAATLNFDHNNKQFGRGETFRVEIKINDVEACINAIEARVKFDIDNLSVEDFLIGNSILSIWLNQPDRDTISLANQTGSLTFSGGVPGGYCGQIPGDPGDSNVLGQIIFKVKDDSVNYKTSLDFGESIVLLNDGLGTEDEVVLNTLELELIDEESGNLEVYQEGLKNDKIKPESFVVELHQNLALFENQYYIIFQTIDKQSGVDRYEVLEIRPGESIGEAPKRSLLDRLIKQKRNIVDWRVVKTPHLLKDQTLESIIKVRAIDKAGNIREVSFIPPESERQTVRNASYKGLIMLLLIVGFIILSLLTIIIILKKSHAKKNKEDQL